MKTIACAGLTLGAILAYSAALAHPLEGLSPEEYQQINTILRDGGLATDDTLYPLIELREPPKAEVLAWKDAGAALPDRRATVYLTDGDGGFRKALVNITDAALEQDEAITGQPMVMFTEFLGALEGALQDQRMIDGLAKRGLTPDQAFCLPLTAGNFFDGQAETGRFMKVPCYQVPSGSNFYAKPVEGLFALYNIATKEVVEVIDEGVIDLPTDAWGYTEDEVAARTDLRPDTNPVRMVQDGGPNFTLDGSSVEWDIWRFNFRVDKRPGLVLNNLDVNDDGTWRSVIYQAHLSEVFVPYMDPGEGWYWRTYMDSGEYGFGLFMTPLTRGVDCPDYATYMPAVIADDAGNPLEIPDAICIFERSLGDPAWRHFEVFAQTPEAPVPAEGRPMRELIVRTASEVGNYDYLIDYRLSQNGDIRLMVGATGLDAVKGVVTTSMDDPTAAADTQYGTLIAPNLVAPNHDHFFNFRIDFDIDQPTNHFMTMDIVPAEVPADVPRRSMWAVQNTMPDSEMDARYQMSAMKPRYYHYSNPERKGYLGHEPGWMIHHGSNIFSPFDFENDPPMIRNPYIEYSLWNTVHDEDQRYAGGEYAMQSDGKDTLAQWAADDQMMHGQDIVAWFTAGLHHIPRMEDWPVMSTEWKEIHIMPHNFFAHNPALTLRGDN